MTMRLKASRDTVTGHETIDVDEAWRVHITARNGDAIEVIEQVDGSFAICAVTALGNELTIQPVARNRIILKVKP